MPQDSTTEKGRKSSSIDGKVGLFSSVDIAIVFSYMRGNLSIHIATYMQSCIANYSYNNICMDPG